MAAAALVLASGDRVEEEECREKKSRNLPGCGRIRESSPGWMVVVLLDREVVLRRAGFRRRELVQAKKDIAWDYVEPAPLLVEVKAAREQAAVVIGQRGGAVVELATARKSTAGAVVEKLPVTLGSPPSIHRKVPMTTSKMMMVAMVQCCRAWRESCASAARRVALLLPTTTISLAVGRPPVVVVVDLPLSNSGGCQPQNRCRIRGPTRNRPGSKYCYRNRRSRPF